MDISANTQTDADENVSCGYPSKQEDYEQNGVCRPGGVRDEGAIGTHTGNDNILCKPLSKATSDDLCNPPNNLVDDIHSPRANPQMDGHENGSSGYATNQEDCEPNEVAKSGEAGDDCSIRTHTSNDNNICDTLSKLAINGHKSVDDLYKPPASAQIDVDESRSCGYPSKLKNLNQNGVVNGRAAGDDCSSETHTGNHSYICDPPSKPNINEYMLVDDLCNPPGNPQMDADENGPGGCPSKQENCKQHKVTKPERAGDDCSIGTLSSNSIAHNVGSSASKSTVHGYSYKLVDDFIFSDRSLIGKFTRLRPSIQELSQWSNINWSSKMRSIWMFKMIGHGFYKIEFFGQEDCDFVLENGPWFMGVAGLSLKRWSPDFDPQNPGPLKTPIWMSLFDLPLEFCNEDSLIKICSKVGKVLQIAESTTEMNGGTTAARVCVEVDLKEGLLASIDLHCSGNSLTQDLDYEGIPFRCKICRSSEHLDGSCPRKSAKNARRKK